MHFESLFVAQCPLFTFTLHCRESKIKSSLAHSLSISLLLLFLPTPLLPFSSYPHLYPSPSTNMNNDDKENLAPAQYNTCRADHIPRLSPRVPLMPMIHASELTMVKLGNLSLQNSARIIIVFDCGRMAMSADRSKLSSISSVLRRAVSVREPPQ
jgi:hypothetical protein